MTAHGDRPAIRAVWLYPRAHDVYADRGNVIALEARCAALGVGCEVTRVSIGDPAARGGRPRADRRRPGP